VMKWSNATPVTRADERSGRRGESITARVKDVSFMAAAAVTRRERRN
jgi:hypothetical protein